MGKINQNVYGINPTKVNKDEMKSNIKISEKIFRRDIVFLTLDNSDASASLAQHAFRPRIDGEIGRYGQMYGNISLCNRFTAQNQDGHLDLELHDHEKQSTSVCKTCLRVYDNLKP